MEITNYYILQILLQYTIDTTTIYYRYYYYNTTDFWCGAAEIIRCILSINYVNLCTVTVETKKACIETGRVHQKLFEIKTTRIDS